MVRETMKPPESISKQRDHWRLLDLVRGSGNATGRQGFSAGKRYGNAPKKLAIFNST